MTMLFLTSPNRLHAKNGNTEKIRKPSVIKYRRFSFPLNKTQCTPLTVKAYSCKLFWADDSFKSEFFQLTPSYRITKLHVIFFKTSFVNPINFFILKRQFISDLYRSEMNCRQPVRAAKILTIQKSDDKM